MNTFISLPSYRLKLLSLCFSMFSISASHPPGYVGAHLSSSTRMKASALLCEFSILNLHFRLSWRFSSTKFKFPICRSALCLRFVKPFRILISFFSFALSRYSLMNSLLNENNKKRKENLKENEKKCRETCRCATWLTNLPAFYKHIFTHTHAHPLLSPPFLTCRGC